MLTGRVFRWTVALLAVSTAVWLACGEDGPTGTGGGGGVGGGSNLTIPAGTYSFQLVAWVCGAPDTVLEFSDSEVICSAEVVDAFLDFECPIKISRNTLTLDCTLQEEASPGCTVTSVLNGSGTKLGDNYEISGTITSTASPNGCYTDGCFQFEAAIMRIGDAPSACQYADASTVELNVGGGPFSGSRTLDAAGLASTNVSAVSFDVFAFYSDSPPVRTAASYTSLGLTFSTPFTEPASLPQTFPVMAQAPGAQQRAGGESSAAGVDVVLLSYTESRDNPFYSFYADSVLSGSLTINELSPEYIAGTMNLNLRGLEYVGEIPNVTTRSLAGGYFVRGQPFLLTAGESSHAEKTLVAVLRRGFHLAPE